MDQGKTGAVIISPPYVLRTSGPPDLRTARLQDRKTARPQDRKTARLQDRKTARPQDRKTLRPSDLQTLRLSDLYPHLLHQQRGVEAGAYSRSEAVVEEKFLVVYLHIKMIVPN